MKGCIRAVGLLLPMCLAVLAGCAAPPEVMDLAALSGLKRIAVLPLRDGPGRHGNNSGWAVADFITSELHNSRRYTLVERSKLKAVVDEQDLQASDLVDPSTAKKLGKLLGADGVIIGSVCQYDMDKTVVYIHVVPVVSREYKVGATVKIVDVENGEIIYAHTATGNSGSNFAEAGRLAAKNLFAPVPK